LHLWQNNLHGKMNLDERRNLMYIEEEGEEINPRST
jgi:hypothetical protein